MKSDAPSHCKPPIPDADGASTGRFSSRGQRFDIGEPHAVRLRVLDRCRNPQPYGTRLAKSISLMVEDCRHQVRWSPCLRLLRSLGVPLFGRFGTNSEEERWLATRTASPKTPKQCHAGSYSRIKPGHPVLGRRIRRSRFDESLTGSHHDARQKWRLRPSGWSSCRRLSSSA